MAVRFVARSGATVRLAANTMDVLLAASNVKTGIDRGDGTIGTYGGGGGYTYGDEDADFVLTTATGAGNYIPPDPADVRFGTDVGTTTGTCYVPSAADVQYGVSVDATTGTFVVPDEADVRDETGYGAGGTEFEGTLVVPDYSSVTVAAGRVQQICEALVALLAAADLAAAFYETIGATRVYTTLSDLSEVGGSVVAVVAPQMTKRARNSNGTYGRYVVIDILVRIHLTNDATADRTTMDNRAYLLEQIDNYLAAEANCDLTLIDGALAEYVEPIDERADSDIRNGLGVLWDAEDLLEKRQVTGLVRVAYWVDESY